MVPRSIALIALIICAGFFAAAETAYSFCNGVRIRLLAEDGVRSARRVVRLLDKYERTVVTLLIAVNVIHVTAASVATVMATELFDDIGPVIATAVVTLAVFLFSETLPKNIARTNADRLALAFSLPVTAFSYLLLPFAAFFLWLGGAVKKLMRIKSDEPVLTEDEFASLVDDVEDEGLIEPEETEIIKSAIEFGDLTAADIMCEREAISAIPINISHERLKQIVLEEKYSRFPVYDGNIDHTIGIIQSTSCLWNFVNKKTFKIKNLLSKPYFVRPETPLYDIFEEMGRKRTHLALVRSDDGKVAGLLTMEDILEELVGEIYDEDDDNTFEAPAEAPAEAPSDENGKSAKGGEMQ